LSFLATRGAIGIQLRGWLGNQMFQYAAAQTLADRLGCSLVLAGHTLGRRLGVIGHVLGLDRRQEDKKILQKGMQRNGLLQAAFGCGPGFCGGRAAELAIPQLRRLWLRQTFVPHSFEVGDSSHEEFDARLFDQRQGTWLSGWFQSEKYFAANLQQVRAWFRPKAEVERRVEEAMARWPRPPEAMAALHVRRGDYGIIRDAMGDGERGWLLPMTYYREALARIPNDVSLVIFSDAPDWAAHEFADLHPVVSRGNSAAVDMFLMARCRWNVTANSSFSWWAAWLNRRDDKIVFAPRHHLGWRVGRWVPGGIEVAGWHYLAVAR